MAAEDGVGGVGKLNGQLPAQRGAWSDGSCEAAGGAVWAGLPGTAAPEDASPAVRDEREEDTRDSKSKWQADRKGKVGQSARQRPPLRNDRAAKNVTLPPSLADVT